MVNTRRAIQGGGRMFSAGLGGNTVFYPAGIGPGTAFFVDTTLGSASNDGLSWERAFNTITLAMTAVGNLASRGRAVIYAAPGGYTEDITTPTNTLAPFCSLIGINPTMQSRGAAYLASSTATEPNLTVLARGWSVDGFEFDAPATDGCIMLSGSGAKFFELANCLMVGSTYASGFAIDTTDANPLVVLRDSYFYQHLNVAVTSTNVFTLQWEVARCVFWNNGKHIAPKNSKGWQAGWIHDSIFMDVGSQYNATLLIDMRGGSTVHVGPNNFLGGTYSNVGGYYAGSGDFWRGNHSSASENGSAQANPA
ncbi:hypothetical protein LCGC14_2132910 [marine sediment metagenome]|uniref:DUF1565 domain-containing protein n=1 Tax=marine sediment metagenome TaxID=412755 RepID=A0A0F9EN02_9ZZZZ